MSEFSSGSELYSEGWEKRNKHIFILSSSGKPIFSRYGDEQDMSTTFGLVQAMISVVQDQGDAIQCIKAGSRRIVFFIRNNLYFVCVTSTDEPEVVILKQLEFMYNQILFILTDQVHRILEENSAKDLRDLLGPDATRIMHAACDTEFTPPSIAFHAVPTILLEANARKELIERLHSCVDSSGAALGLMLYRDSLMAYCVNPETPLHLDVSDVLLLSHFVGNSSSLRSRDQNWVPLCLPAFNSSAILQAYICNMRIAAPEVNDPQNLNQINISLILVSASADPQLFPGLHEGRLALERSLKESVNTVRALISSLTTKLLQELRTKYFCFHYFYKVNARRTQNYASTQPEFPINSDSAMHSIWTYYQKLAMYLRAGTCTAEETLSGVPGAAGESDANILTFSPASDHSLAYVKLESGFICIGLATSDTELYATFPDVVGVVDACGFANQLSRALKLSLNAGNIFQIKL
eukprot:GSChrysophyteH1.ASY1.ANO1.2317.1 assembled CDS